MKRSRLLLVVLVILLISLLNFKASGQSGLTAIEYGEKIDYVTYTGTTDKIFKVGWDDQALADYYLFYLNNMEREEKVTVGKVTTNQIEFQLPRSGHWIGEVYACQNGVDGAEDTCAGPSLTSDDSVATVEGVGRAWWIYGYLAKPGDINLGQRLLRMVGIGKK